MTTPTAMSSRRARRDMKRAARVARVEVMKIAEGYERAVALELACPTCRLLRDQWGTAVNVLKQGADAFKTILASGNDATARDAVALYRDSASQSAAACNAFGQHLRQHSVHEGSTASADAASCAAPARPAAT